MLYLSRHIYIYIFPPPISCKLDILHCLPHTSLPQEPIVFTLFYYQYDSQISFRVDLSWYHGPSNEGPSMTSCNYSLSIISQSSSNFLLFFNNESLEYIYLEHSLLPEMLRVLFLLTNIANIVQSLNPISTFSKPFFSNNSKPEWFLDLFFLLLLFKAYYSVRTGNFNT